MQNAPVDEHWCLVHATHTNTRELDQIVAAGAVVALCPLTESSLGDGIFPAPAFVEQNGRFGIGTDSNIRIDVAEELRTLEYAQRLDLQARNVLASGAGKSTGRSLFDTALAGGARALRASRRSGKGRLAGPGESRLRPCGAGGASRGRHSRQLDLLRRPRGGRERLAGRARK